MKTIEQIVRLTIDGDETRAKVIGEVVRCGSCRYSRVKEGDDYCSLHSFYMPYESFFCSDGEEVEE